MASDFGNTVVGVRQADQGAWIEMVMVPDGLPAGLVKAVVAAVSAEIEGDCRLLVVERQGQPLMLVSREYVTRPWRRDVLASIFHEFAGKTVMALAQAVTAEQHERDEIAVEVMAG